MSVGKPGPRIPGITMVGHIVPVIGMKYGLGTVAHLRSTSGAPDDGDSSDSVQNFSDNNDDESTASDRSDENDCDEDGSDGDVSNDGSDEEEHVRR
ncbi:unnamed protein product [Phytophthora fragariaefolia]|uniref:Unnamed protein product n=1 Tax=Phytophthora fragariaefolia TaxID=1490495 RepID=A0A9W7CTE8_9STRA|nr:unnamed protein product [Phytophthora fragariaefolia]